MRGKSRAGKNDERIAFWAVAGLEKRAVAQNLSLILTECILASITSGMPDISCCTLHHALRYDAQQYDPALGQPGSHRLHRVRTRVFRQQRSLTGGRSDKGRAEPTRAVKGQGKHVAARRGGDDLEEKRRWRHVCS